LPAGHNDAGWATAVEEPVSKSQFKGVALAARSRPARIHLLDGSLYTWLGAKALSQVSLMRRNQRGILL
jgi:hypothetical protein